MRKRSRNAFQTSLVGLVCVCLIVVSFAVCLVFIFLVFTWLIFVIVYCILRVSLIPSLSFAIYHLFCVLIASTSPHFRDPEAIHRRPGLVQTRSLRALHADSGSAAPCWRQTGNDV
jgi:hypothetical protein